MKVKKLSRYEWPGPGLISTSLESKTNRRETHTGTFLEMRKHVTKKILRHCKWDGGQTVVRNTVKDRLNKQTLKIGFLGEIRIAKSG